MFKSFRRDSKTPNISVEGIVSRGVSEVFPSKEYLKKLLNSDKKATLYLGIDPTGPSLHLGHAIVLKKLQEFQTLGHKIILLIGDFTGMIGDPTDKSATRKKLSKEEVLSNAKLYKKQAGTFLNFSGVNRAELKYNSKWLSAMKFADVLELASNMTVDQMLKRDMFEVRAKEGKPIYIHEFLYPLLQGYDSVAMEVDGEIGGNDQLFNMLAGRTLLKQIKNKEKFVMTMKLLEDGSGRKMGKTEGNMVSLDDSATEMFGKVMSWTDGMIVPGMELCTNIDVSEIEVIKNEIEKGTLNPKEYKISLAKEIVKIYHSEDEAKKAAKNFTDTFSGGSVSKDAEEANNIRPNTPRVDVLLDANLVSSKKDFQRLVVSGAVTSVSAGRKITDINEKITEDEDLKIGKHRFIKIRVKK